MSFILMFPFFFFFFPLTFVLSLGVMYIRKEDGFHLSEEERWGYKFVIVD